MKIATGVVIIILVIATAGPVRAQVTGDPFDDIHGDLMRAAAKQADEVRSASRVSRDVRETPLAELQWDASAARHITNSGMRRLHQLQPVLANIFRSEGVPQEFLLVGLIESGYRADAVSPAQAVGVWQFVLATAQRFGLVNEQGDFRTDVVRSTRAAARYLRLLLDRFQDWRLALAAYNAGEDRVEEAIRKAKSRDFSELSRRRLLPAETLQYVPAVLEAIAQARNHGLIDRSSSVLEVWRDAQPQQRAAIE